MILYEPVHNVERDVLAGEPGIGTKNVSACLPGWIKTLCEKFEEGEGYHLSHGAVSALCHTLIAARSRQHRLIFELTDKLK